MSVQVKGSYAIYAVLTGGREILLQRASADWWSPGGTADGTPANATPDKWNFLPLHPMKFGPGTKIVFKLKAASNKTIDASDCFMDIPIIVNGVQQRIGNSAHATGIMAEGFTVEKAASDIAYVADIEAPVWIYRANEGTVWQLGQGKVNASIEDNT